jgi:hypothetical protein
MTTIITIERAHETVLLTLVSSRGSGVTNATYGPETESNKRLLSHLKDSIEATLLEPLEDWLAIIQNATWANHAVLTIHHHESPEDGELEFDRVLG